MKYYFKQIACAITFLLAVVSFQVHARTSADQDTTYIKKITKRAEKIVAQLEVSDQQKSAKVCDIIVEQYRNLNQVHTEKENKLKEAKSLRNTNVALAEEQINEAENEANAHLYKLHFDFLSKLMIYLNENQLEQVKDGMTYGIFPLTYKGYLEMIPRLTEEQKLQIKVWLIEAREYAMDAGSSDEKHKWFGKYKGRINNYLSAAGYDMKKESKDWQDRIKKTQNQSDK